MYVTRSHYLTPQLTMIVRNQRCSRVNDEVVRVIAEGSPKLRSFAAAHCFGVSDLGVKLLTDRCCELLHLDFQYCSITDEALQQVSVKCPDLGFLDVSGCEDVTDAGLAALKHCRHLGIVLANGCPQVRHSSARIVSPTLTICPPQLGSPNIYGGSGLVSSLNCNKIARTKRLRELLNSE
jgi:hypothetical protein